MAKLSAATPKSIKVEVVDLETNTSTKYDAFKKKKKKAAALL